MRKHFFFILSTIWMCILSIFMFVFWQYTGQIMIVKEKLLLQEQAMLKQAEILAVNTTLLQAVFRALSPAMHDHPDSSVPDDDVHMLH